MNKQWSSKLQLWNFEVWIPKLTGAKGEFALENFLNPELSNET